MEVDSRRLRSDVADIFARRSIHDGSDILARLQAKFRSASKEPNALKEIDVDEMPMHSNGNNSQNINKRRKKKKKSPTKKKGQSSQSQYLVKESKQEVESLTLTWEHSPCAHNTTLYKAVPYTRIPRDAEIKNFIESLRTNPQLKEELELDREEFELLNITGPDCGPQATPAGPVLHVKSIAICKAKQDLEDLQIFGQISITDYEKNTFYLFSCEPDQSHRVSSDSNLVFSHCPMAPVLGGKMKFSLRNLPGTPQVFKEDKVFSLEYACKDDCEEDIYQEFPLEGGYYAKMVYNKIPRAALVRCVMFLDHNQPGCEEQFYKVHGSVKVNNVVCVDRDNSSKSLYVKYGEGSFNQVSRTVFALPIGSPLKVEYKLYHGDFEFANDKYVVPTHYMQGGMEDEEYLPCKDEHYRLGMTIRWYLYDGFFDRRRQLKAYVKMRPMDYINVKWSTDFSQEYMQRTDNDLVEVFSILVGCVNSAPPVLCGRIVVRDAYGKVYIFARNKDLPDKYLSKKQRFERTVSVAWPDRWFTRKDFFMHLWLKDGNEELLCKGDLSWENGSRRFDRRLCDVITYGNEKGYYAVVHYSVFKNGKKAKVSVKCNEKDGYSRVCGTVFAAYDNNDDYPSTYDKECYRSIVFNRSKEDCVSVDNRSEIPLSKTHVSTPSDCIKLIVDADLWVYPNTGTSYQRVSAELHFEASRDGSQSKQVGCVVVTVSWSQ